MSNYISFIYQLHFGITILKENHESSRDNLTALSHASGFQLITCLILLCSEKYVRALFCLLRLRSQLRCRILDPLKVGSVKRSTDHVRERKEETGYGDELEENGDESHTEYEDALVSMIFHKA